MTEAKKVQDLYIELIALFNRVKDKKKLYQKLALLNNVKLLHFKIKKAYQNQKKIADNDFEVPDTSPKNQDNNEQSDNKSDKDDNIADMNASELSDLQKDAKSMGKTKKNVDSPSPNGQPVKKKGKKLTEEQKAVRRKKKDEKAQKKKQIELDVQQENETKQFFKKMVSQLDNLVLKAGQTKSDFLLRIFELRRLLFQRFSLILRSILI